MIDVGGLGVCLRPSAEGDTLAELILHWIVASEMAHHGLHVDDRADASDQTWE